MAIGRDRSNQIWFHHVTGFTAAHRVQADALEIEAQAKRRLADEYDAAQERGEVATRSDQNLLPDRKKVSVSDIGLTHKDIHEARIIRDAEKVDPGVVRRARSTKCRSSRYLPLASCSGGPPEAARRPPCRTIGVVAPCPGILLLAAQSCETIRCQPGGISMPVTPRVADRITSQLKRYQAVINQAQQRDVGESDTALIISDMLSDVFGYNKYEHITTEHAIRGTFVDLAIEVDGELRFLIEVKAIGVPLKDNHVKQAIDYGANKGVEWVLLTNGATWRVYKIIFSQPIDKALVCEVDMLSTSHRSPEVLECFGNLSKEGFSKGSMSDLLQQKQVTSKFALATILLGDVMVDTLRRELRRLSPGLRIDSDALRSTLSEQVIKRELIDSDDAQAAQAAVKKRMRVQAREKSRRNSEGGPSHVEQPVATEAAQPTTAVE